MSDASDLDDIARLVNPHGEQAQHAARTWALQVAAYYQTLRTAGLGPEARTALTRDYQGILLQQAAMRQRWEGEQ